LHNGGISNTGRLTLNDNSSVSDNSADLGGGIYLYWGDVTLNGSSTVTRNTATSYGGGIYWLGAATMTVNEDGTVSDNTAGIDGDNICPALPALP
jgi:predicted outer membrane repeat protein